ncbi:MULTISPECIES: hypothetical protein [unclassified Streptomyces]
MQSLNAQCAQAVYAAQLLTWKRPKLLDRRNARSGEAGCHLVPESVMP